MKVFALLTDGPGARGGIARYNEDLLFALAGSARVEGISILARSGMQLGTGLPANTTWLKPEHRRWIFVLRALLNARYFRRYDWIFCGHLYMLPLAVLLSRLTGAGVWLQLHGIEAWQERGRITGLCLRQVAFVTAVSRYTRRRFLEWSGVAPERVKVLPNTLSDKFTPVAERQAPGKKEKILLSVSRLTCTERYKGQDRVLAALAGLGPQERFRFLIAGEGDDIPRLQALVERLGLQANADFIGYVPDEQLPSLYREADIFAMPSTGEGFGIVFLQALASGCTVIAGNRDGSCDPLLDGRAGILVDPESAEALEAAIKQAMEQPQDGTFAAAVFSRENFSAKLRALVEHVSTVPRPAGGG